jgi:transcriptional regulator with XRE-family HTH domain
MKIGVEKSMDRIKLTEELSRLIKTTRISNNIKAIELANYLGKSVAYVTKLENTQFKSIDYNLLINMLQFLTKESGENFNEFISKTLEKCSIEKANEEDWFVKFDRELRRIPIPQKLIEFISEELLNHNIKSTELIEYINKNEDLDDLNVDLSKYDHNARVAIDNRTCIIFDLDANFIDDILSKKIKSINYISMLAIIYHLNKLNTENKDEAYSNSIKILNSFRFYTLNERDKLLKNSDTRKIQNEILSEYEKKNIKYVNNILRKIKIISDWNVDYANEKLAELEKTFNIDDPSFSLALICRKFYKLKNLNINDKRVFLKEMDDLITRFENIEYTENDNFEAY